VAGKSFTVVDYLSKVYKLLDAYRCIDENLLFYLILKSEYWYKVKLFFSKKKIKFICFLKKNEMQNYNKIDSKTIASAYKCEKKMLSKS
jgi:hypothetical protein